jgi:predicted DNA-binding protein
MQNGAPVAKPRARRRSFNITIRMSPTVAYALMVLAKSEDRTRTHIVNRAIKHYLESYYPATKKLANQVRTINLNLKMWAAGVRSEALWGDKGVRFDSSNSLDEAFEEALKLALYAAKRMKLEMSLHTYMLASYLAEARAMMLQGAERTALLEIALNAEKELDSLEEMVASGKEDAEGEAKTQADEERQPQSSEG